MVSGHGLYMSRDVYMDGVERLMSVINTPFEF